MKPYLEDKRDLVNNSEKFEGKIRMLLIYNYIFHFAFTPLVNAVYEKNK